jgi:perosamine synthetase
VDVGSVAALAASRTSAILLTHQWGQPADLATLADISGKHGLALIEDCSHAHGTCYRGKPVGTFGTFSFFSCGTTKMVSGGTGGMLVTKHTDLFERALSFGQPKSRCEAIESPHVRRLGRVGAGVNLRGNPFSAVLAIDHLQALDNHIAQKSRNLSLVDEILSSECEALRPVPRQTDWTRGTWYKRPYSVEATQADAWVRAASRCGIPLSHQDPPLDELLEPVGKEYGIDWPKLGSPARESTRLVVLNTLDMYSVEWNADHFRELVRGLRAIAA